MKQSSPLSERLAILTGLESWLGAGSCRLQGFARCFLCSHSLRKVQMRGSLGSLSILPSRSTSPSPAAGRLPGTGWPPRRRTLEVAGWRRCRWLKPSWQMRSGDERLGRTTRQVHAPTPQQQGLWLGLFFFFFSFGFKKNSSYGSLFMFGFSAQTTQKMCVVCSVEA